MAGLMSLAWAGSAGPVDTNSALLGAIALACVFALVFVGVAAVRGADRSQRRVQEQIAAERRRMEAQLQLSERMAQMGAIAAGVGHEINNPLAYVGSNLKFAIDELAALRDALGPQAPRLEPVIAALADAHDGTGHVAVIVRDLKTFTGGDEESVGPVSLVPVLESAISMSRHERKHHVRLVRQFSGAPLVVGNSVRLGQVFLNLLVNAAHALRPAGGAIRCAVREEGASVVVEIADTGSGIAPEHLQRIFQPFFTTKPAGEGTGLGLALCHRIVTSLGGTIEVESELGRGTLFRVRLRAAAAAPELRQAA